VRILLFGGTGQVGRELRRALAPLGTITAPSRSDVPLDDADAVAAAVRAAAPDVLVNAAAYTAVDAAETDEPAAHAVNAVAPGVMADLLRGTGGTLVHYSTDYFFDGTKAGAYVESDTPAPLGAYGRTKLAGEEAVRAAGCGHVILRTSWVYGLHGTNFLRTMVRLGAERDTLRVVADQYGAPTWSRLIAGATAALLASARAELPDLRGTWHLAAGGVTSWHGFARAILGRWHAERSIDVVPIDTAAYGAPAPRPRNSRLDCGRIAADFGIALPDWKAALDLVREDALDPARR
jgi:dTDP-4-dehydrorhamnose reductase